MNGKNMGYNRMKKILISAIIAVVAFTCIFAVVYTISTGTLDQCEQQLRLGNKYLAEMNYEEAIVAFNKVIEIEPRHVAARIGAGKAYIALGQYDNALYILNEALEIEPQNSEALDLLDQAITAMKDLYTPIVQAYKDFEASKFRTYDESLIGDSLLAIGKDWDSSNAGLGIDINAIQLRYSLYDISGDGIPELVIAAKDEYGTRIFGIYTIVENSAVSVLQKDNSRDYIIILNNLIIASWGHMGDFESIYYKFENGNEFRVVEGFRMHMHGYDEETDQPRYEYERGLTKFHNYEDNNTTKITEEEYEAIVAEYEADGVLLEWHILSGWNKHFSSYNDAFLHILDEHQNEIIGYTGADRLSSYNINGGVVALVDIYGDSTPELIYIKTLEESDSTYAGNAQLNIWTYENETPRLLLMNEFGRGDRSNEAIFTDRDGNLYIYTKTYYSYRGNVSHDFTKYIIKDGQFEQDEKFSSLRNSSEDIGSASGDTRAEYNVKAAAVIGDIDKMIFQLGVYDEYENQIYWDTYNERLWGNVLPVEDGRITYNEAVEQLNRNR